jgi:dihydrolipoamide dehydrogenase
MNERYDLAVIGGGPGGYVAAIRASQYGLKVALIEEREMGGTCLNRGCIPTKSLLHSAEVFNTVKSCSEFGVSVENPGFDYKKMADKKDAAVKQLRSGVEYLVKSSGAAIINGRALIKDKNTIEVTGENVRTVTTDKIIIATGSKPLKPPIPGIGSQKVLTSDEVLNLRSCPDSVVIIGGGVIGVEFATIFNSLGKNVTIIEMLESILPGIDTEISGLMRKSLEKKGIKIFTGGKVTSISSAANTACIFEQGDKEQRAEGDIVIVAVGRKPNTEGIGLENIGIKTERGFVKVNDKLETTVDGVYAIGDITGKVLLAHLASAQGLTAAANASGKNLSMGYSIVPGCIYTSPEIAMVGLTEAEAIKKGYQVKIGRFPVSANGKSMVMGEREGLAKIVTDEATGGILGAHIMGPRATDMIAELCAAMKLESTIEELTDTIHPHPTVSEIIMEACHDVQGLCVHKPKR